MSESKNNNYQERDAFVRETVEELQKWTGIQDPALNDAVRDFSGSLYTEMRKMTKRICRYVESTNMDEEVKNQIKEQIGDTWYNIKSRQKIGASKLAIIINNHINSKV